MKVERSKVLLSKLKKCREKNFTGILAGDESWFVFCYEPTHRWMLQNEKPEDIIQPTNFQKKVMISPDGQYLIDILHFDNAPVHKSKLTIENIDNSNFELIPKPLWP